MIKDNELQVLRHAFSEFVDFADALWQGIGLPPLTPRQREIANEMQYGPDRLFVACFRGIGKSYLGGAYALWCGFHDPDEIILILSGSKEKAAEISEWMRSVVAHPDLPWLNILAPKDGGRRAVGAWDFGAARATKQSASVTIASVGAAIQGKRATRVILDDCEQMNNSDSETRRSTLLRKMMDTANMIIPDRESNVRVLGTYQSLNSVYRVLVAERGYSAFVIPALVPSDPDLYDGTLAPGVLELCEDQAKHGTPTDTRFSAAHLKKQELELGPIDWQVQMMLLTVIADRMAHPFSLSDMVVWDGVNPYGAPARIVPGRSEKERLEDLPCYGLPGDAFYGPAHVDQSDMIPYLSVVMAIDPAGNNGADETGYVVIGAVPGNLYLLDSGGFLKGSSTETMERLAHIAKKYQVRQYLIESNLVAWASLFQQHAFPIHKAGIEEIPAYKNKVLRIRGALDPVLSGGKLVVARSVIEDEYSRALRAGYGGGNDGARRARARLLQYQVAMLRLNEKDGGLEHDDRIDALALGLEYLAPLFLQSDAERKLGEQAAARTRDQDEMLLGYQLDPFQQRAQSRSSGWARVRHRRGQAARSEPPGRFRRL